MNAPIKRKNVGDRKRRCPINIDSLYRRFNRGDKRIDWPRIRKFIDDWHDGVPVPWKELGPTFIKSGPRPARRRARRRTPQIPRTGPFNVAGYFEAIDPFINPFMEEPEDR